MGILTFVQEMLSKLTEIYKGVALLAVGKYLAFFQVMIPLVFIGLHAVDADVVLWIDLVLKDPDVTNLGLFLGTFFIALEVRRLD